MMDRTNKSNNNLYKSNQGQKSRLLQNQNSNMLFLMTKKSELSQMNRRELSKNNIEGDNLNELRNMFISLILNSKQEKKSFG